jgi:hypothetical protein
LPAYSGNLRIVSSASPSLPPSGPNTASSHLGDFRTFRVFGGDFFFPVPSRHARGLAALLLVRLLLAGFDFLNFLPGVVLIHLGEFPHLGPRRLADQQDRLDLFAHRLNHLINGLGESSILANRALCNPFFGRDPFCRLAIFPVFLEGWNLIPPLPRTDFRPPRISRRLPRWSG